MIFNSRNVHNFVTVGENDFLIMQILTLISLLKVFFIFAHGAQAVNEFSSMCQGLEYHILVV